MLLGPLNIRIKKSRQAWEWQRLAYAITIWYKRAINKIPCGRASHTDTPGYFQGQCHILVLKKDIILSPYYVLCYCALRRPNSCFI